MVVKSASQKTWSEHALTALLAKKFRAPAYAFFPQARNGTGFTRVTRTCDAVAVSLWPSRGLEVQGFEIKVARSDLTKELAAPEKSIEWQSRCHRWWLVAPAEVLADQVIPATWGVMSPAKNGQGLSVVRDAPALEPKELGIRFLAALCRDVHERYVPRASIEEIYRVHYQNGHAAGERVGGAVGRAAVGELENLKRQVAEFESASGVKIDRWRGNRSIGAAVKAVLQRGARDWADELERESERLRAAAEAIKKELEAP